MDEKTAKLLDSLNREFYQTFSESFDSTRFRIQPGVRKILEQHKPKGWLLDLGCGNGNILIPLKDINFKGHYIGLDFSDRLIQKAKERFENLDKLVGFQANLLSKDLVFEPWENHLPNTEFDLVFSFATIHHIAPILLEKYLLQKISSVLKGKGHLILSVWQPQNSSKLMERIQAWEKTQISKKDVGKDDILLDWQAEKDLGKSGLRYVHIYRSQELGIIARRNGFEIIDQFYSDGKQGNLGLYQSWKKLM